MAFNTIERPQEKIAIVDLINNCSKRYALNTESTRNADLIVNRHLHSAIEPEQSKNILNQKEIQLGKWAEVSLRMEYGEKNNELYCKSAEKMVNSLSTKLEHDFITEEPGSLDIDDYLSPLAQERHELAEKINPLLELWQFTNDYGVERYNYRIKKDTFTTLDYLIRGESFYNDLIRELMSEEFSMPESDIDKENAYQKSFSNPVYQIEISRAELERIYKVEPQSGEKSNQRLRILIPLSTLKRGKENNIIHHPNHIFIPLIKNEVQKLFNQIHSEKRRMGQTMRKQSKGRITNAVGKIHWLMSHFPFYINGSAAITHQFTQAILRSCGFTAAKVPEGSSPDLTALLHCNVDKYSNLYEKGHKGPIGLFLAA